jgi:1-aminocyclopropane-1-carboxylate deaminase
MTDAFKTGSSNIHPLVAPCLGRTSGIFIKRDDLIHPIVSGNKWRKLKYHISEAQKNNKNHLVTYGGAFSNHMVAVACASAVLGMKSSCFVRGEEIKPGTNHYTRLASLYGMELISVPRDVYRSKKEELFHTHFGNAENCVLIPEGGSGASGEKGVAEIIAEFDFAPDIILHASATATTARGLAQGMQLSPEFANSRLMSIPVLLNSEEQTSLIADYENTEIIHGFECGGYAKVSPELMKFVKEFISQTGILIDPVYTGKALFGLKKLIENNKITSAQTVVFIHTGGVLGIFSNHFLGFLENES